MLSYTAAMMMHQPGSKTAAGAADAPTPHSSLIQAADALIARHKDLLKHRDYIQADDVMWQLLRSAGITNLQTLKSSSSDHLRAQVPAELHGQCSFALTQIGISYLRLRQERHLHAFLVLEHAVGLDPSNLLAVANLSDLAVEVNTQRLALYQYRGEKGWPCDDFEAEAARERSVVLGAISRGLELRFGLGAKHIAGLNPINSPSNPTERAYLCWCLGNVAKIHLSLAKLAASDSARAEFHLTASENAALSALQGVGLSRQWERVVPRILAALEKSHEPWNSQTPNVANSFNTLGSIAELRRQFLRAMDCYFLAAQVMPSLAFAKGRLTALAKHNPHYDPASSLRQEFVRPKLPSKETAVVETWADKRSKVLPESLPEPILEESGAAPERIVLKGDSWHGFLNLAADVAVVDQNPAKNAALFALHVAEKVNEWWERSDEGGYIELIGTMLLLKEITISSSAGTKEQAASAASTLEDIEETQSLLHGLDSEARKRIQHEVRQFIAFVREQLAER